MTATTPVELDLIAGLTQRTAWGRVYVEACPDRTEISVWLNPATPNEKGWGFVVQSATRPSAVDWDYVDRVLASDACATKATQRLRLWDIATGEATGSRRAEDSP